MENLRRTSTRHARRAATQEVPVEQFVTTGRIQDESLQALPEATTSPMRLARIGGGGLARVAVWFGAPMYRGQQP